MNNIHWIWHWSTPVLHKFISRPTVLVTTENKRHYLRVVPLRYVSFLIARFVAYFKNFAAGVWGGLYFLHERVITLKWRWLIGKGIGKLNPPVNRSMLFCWESSKRYAYWSKYYLLEFYERVRFFDYTFWSLNGRSFSNKVCLKKCLNKLAMILFSQHWFTFGSSW